VAPGGRTTTSAAPHCPEEGLGWGTVCFHFLVLCPVNLDFIVFVQIETALKGAVGAPPEQSQIIHLGIPTLEGSKLDCLHWSM